MLHPRQEVDEERRRVVPVVEDELVPENHGGADQRAVCDPEQRVAEKLLGATAHEVEHCDQ